MIQIDALPIFAIIPSMMAGFLLILLGERVSRSVHVTLTSIVTFIAMISSLILYTHTKDGKVIIHKMGGWSPPIGIVIAVDALNSLFSLVVSLIVLFSTIYSYRYMEHDDGHSYFYALICLMLCGMNGIILTGDLFNLFVFFEISAIASYGLVAFRKDEWEPVEAGFKYAMISAIGTVFLLLGVALIYGLFGVLTMASIAERVSTGTFLEGARTNGNYVIPIAAAFLIWSFGIKAAMAPMHTWLPDAHPAAPSPISAILSGVFVKVGVYAMIRLLYTIYGLSISNDLMPYLAGFGAFSMIVGAYIALVQDDVKRMLAFSTVLNIGFILFGIGIGSKLSLTGSLLHVVNHAITKALLFLAAGSVIYRTEIRSMSRLGGLIKKMPITAIVFLIASLSIVGVPSTNGFISKFIILKAGIETGELSYTIYVVVGVVTSIVAAAYMLRAFRQIFLGEAKSDITHVREAPISMLIPMVILTILIVILGIFPQIGIDLVKPAVESAFGRERYIEQVLVK
ncbi:MAG: NADH-quinone oxidoreductase subunit M [Nitrososphaerota archaeon]|nr:NADH-quinone oxidoreductase subunit M [Nitrososphaerales archaeon]MDW8044486.1 NADH-quinone oxidoreductase subunit M [Nitrososphaerota archaeon]